MNYALFHPIFKVKNKFVGMPTQMSRRMCRGAKVHGANVDLPGDGQLQEKFHHPFYLISLQIIYGMYKFRPIPF
jgi:hypothetical protein